MKRKMISLLITVFLPVSMLVCCGKSDAEQPDASEEASEDESADEDDGDEDADSGNKDNIFSSKKKSSDDDGSKSEKKKKSGDDTEDEDDDSKDSSWQDAYLEYLDANPAEDGGYSYALIYVDDDDIPELVIDTGFEAGGCQILTCHDGKIDELQTARLYFTYIEKENKLNNCDGHMGYYYDVIYSKFQFS